VNNHPKSEISTNLVTVAGLAARNGCRFLEDCSYLIRLVVLCGQLDRLVPLVEADTSVDGTSDFVAL
jgi:hypothetical protein